MKTVRIHSCADDKGFFEDIRTRDQIKCAFDVTKSCYSNCAACNIQAGKVFCQRGVKDDFQIGIIKEEN